AIQTTEGSVIATVNTSVPSRRPPKIVRTIPGRGKTGVPLNKNIVVVFTEPVAESSLAASVKLFRGNAAVSGTAAILQGTSAAVVVAKDAAGNILTGYPVRWTADSSAVEVTSSGLVTERHTGFGTVFAGVNDQVGATIAVRVFDALPAVTSVVVAFDSALVSA